MQSVIVSSKKKKQEKKIQEVRSVRAQRVVVVAVYIK